MAKTKTAIVRFALIIVFMASVFASLFIGFKNVENVIATDVSYKKKIVSVLFDNSTSMASPVEDYKTEQAKYSLEMLASLLSEQDELYLWPMNGATAATNINLLSANRNSEIKNNIIENTALKPMGGTPHESIGRALSTLCERGLKSSSDQYFDENRDIEYWLVILTDGEFDGGRKSDLVLEDYIKDYVGLNTIYLAFGSGAYDITKSEITKKYPLSAYCVEPVNIASSMQDVANKISGRYGAESGSGKYEVSGNAVTVDLDKFNFAVNNVAIMVQNSGATLSSTTYEGKNLTVTQGVTLKGTFPKSSNDQSANEIRLLNDGYTAVVKDGEYMLGGKLIFTFDKAVGDNVTVMVEPAIYIDAYLERENGGVWTKADMQEINSSMRPGDRIRVQYKVYSSADDKELSLSEIFGSPTEKITYCGKAFNVGESIPLEKGKNAIAVSVSVLGGHFTMYSSITCYIEDNPNHYRIEGVFTQGEGDNYKKADLSYEVYENDFKKGKDDLYGYTVEVTIAYPDGSLHNLPYTVGEDGKISAHFNGEGLGFGEYVITAKVTNNESKLSRIDVKTMLIAPKSLKAECLTGEELRITAYILGDENFKVTFGLKLDGEETSYNNSIINYKVKLGTADITDKCYIEDGKLAFDISTENLPSASVGKKTIEVSVDALDTVRDTAFYEFEILSSVYRVEKLDTGSRELIISDLRKTNAAVYFKVYKDDVAITVQEIEDAINNGEISVDTQSFGWITFLPCKVDVVVEELDGEPTVICKVGDKMAGPWDILLSSFIFANQKEISLSYNGATSSDTILIENLSLVGRIWRWLTLLAIILFVIHVLTYILGFFIAKPLPKGTMLKFNIGSNLAVKLSTPMSKKVNMKASEIIMWHLSRFIPFREFKNQKPKSLWGDVEIRVDKKTKRSQLVAKKEMVELIYTQMSTKDGREVQDFIVACRKNGQVKKISISKRSFMNFLRRKPDEKIKKGEVRGISGWYGVTQKAAVGKQEIIKSVITFVDCIKK